MKHKKLSEAMEHISDRHIAEAAAQRQKYPWFAAVAAILVLALTLVMVLSPGKQPEVSLQDPTFTGTLPPDIPLIPQSPLELLSAKYAVYAAEYPAVFPYPKEETEDFDSHYDNWCKWDEGQKALKNQPLGYADSLRPFWKTLVPALLDTEDGKNTACSPVNIYMALAMLAETTGGESQHQLLKLLNGENMESVREQAQHVWRAHYNDDTLSRSILASSLWLQEDLSYNEDVAKLLAENYYASVFRGKLGTEEMDKALQSWLNEQTSNLLKDQTKDIKLPADTLLALATTIDYQVQWRNEFNKDLTVVKPFHGAGGDTSEAFMEKVFTGYYYWAERFSAVSLSLRDGSHMWLFLPDEGVSPDEITEDVVDFLATTHQDDVDRKFLEIRLSLPKFDICGELELSDTLKKLGVTHIFDSNRADFTPIYPEEDGAAVNAIQHAARVHIDEQGVTAAAYTVIFEAGAALPPNERVDFVLDRPFLFVTESKDGLPLFTGIVNEP